MIPFAAAGRERAPAVRPQGKRIASGANNAIRELGGVFGVAVLASVFAHQGGLRPATRSAPSRRRALN